MAWSDGTKVAAVVIGTIIAVLCVAILATNTNDNDEGDGGNGGSTPGTPITTFTYQVTTYTVGSGSVTGAGEYTMGRSATVTATPADGYYFIRWYRNDLDSLGSVSASYTFSSYSDVYLTAEFGRHQYTVNVLGSSSSPPTGSVSGGGKYFYGETATLTASPIYGYEFLGWYSQGGWNLLSSDSTYAIAVTKDQTIESRFGPIHDASFYVYPGDPVAPTTLTFVSKYNPVVLRHEWYVFEEGGVDVLFQRISQDANVYSISISSGMSIEVVHAVWYIGGSVNTVEKTITIGDT